MKTASDDHGQPLNQNLNENRRANRAISELIGFLRGIIADRYVSASECEQLAKWLVANREIADIWPESALVERIDRIYRDGVADEQERGDLAELVTQIVGRQDDETLSFGPTDLPLTIPEPDIVFDGKEFVLTGKFLYGPRRLCQREIETRGGTCWDTVRLQSSYVVIGSLMSRDWKYSTHGTKIEKAVEYRNRCPIAIVSEKQWETSLAAVARSKPPHSSASSCASSISSVSAPLE
ncbi:MAG: BRCT domain-containing protein [Acidobacteriia bacterium]|nr:BRCT domain-containing protein [Terriglobia bacterium]